MDTLTLLDWDAESEREVHFLGWKSGATRSTLYIHTEGRCRQITLRLPYHFNLVFPSEPVPDLPITSIRRTALHYPACFASREEVRKFVEHPPPISMLDASGKAWMHFTRHLWYLESDGAKDLQHRIRSHTISGQKASKRMTFEADISDAAKSHPGFIDEIVIQAWAERYSIDLATMARDARAFKYWLERHAINKQESVLYERRKIPVPVKVLRLSPSQWDILLASVGFELRFKDGSRCWIDGYVESDLLDAKSLTESEALLNQFNEDLSRPATWREIEATILNPKGKPVSRKWLKSLCEKAKVPFPPRTAGELRKVNDWQLRRKELKGKRMRAANKKTTGARLPGR